MRCRVREKQCGKYRRVDVNLVFDPSPEGYPRWKSFFFVVASVVWICLEASEKKAQNREELQENQKNEAIHRSSRCACENRGKGF